MAADTVKTLKEEGYFAILANQILDRWLRKIPDQIPFGWYELEMDGRKQTRVFRLMAENDFLVLEKPKYWIPFGQQERIFKFVEEVIPTSPLHQAYTRLVGGEKYFEWGYMKVGHKLYVYNHREEFELLGYDGPIADGKLIPYDPAIHKHECCLLKMAALEEHEAHNKLLDDAENACFLLENLGHELKADCFIDLPEDIDQFEAALEAKIGEVEEIVEKTRKQIQEFEKQISQMTFLAGMVKHHGGMKQISANFKKKHGLPINN